MSRRSYTRPGVVALAIAAPMVLLPSTSIGAEGAILSRVSPGVALRVGALDAEAYPARPLQIIAPGAVLQLPERGDAVVICADDRAVELSGPSRWQLETGSCAGGSKLPAGSFASLVPRPGRGLVFYDNLLLEAPSRSDDQNGKVPVLVRPRSPQRGTVKITEASPTLVWTAVDRAERYDLIAARLGREEVSSTDSRACRRDELTAPLWSCSSPWPWSPLRPGDVVEIRISAHTPDPDRPVRSADPSSLRLASTQTVSRLRSQLGALERTGLASSLVVLRARIYSDAGFYNEAAEALRLALEGAPNAQVAVQLADLYLGLGQLRAASNLYAEAETLLPHRGDDATRAALYLGQGRLSMRRNESDLAARLFKKATRLFEREGLVVDAEQAANEADRALRGQ